MSYLKHWSDFMNTLTGAEIKELEDYENACQQADEIAAEMANEAHLCGHDDYGFVSQPTPPSFVARLKNMAQEYNDANFSPPDYDSEDDCPF